MRVAILGGGGAMGGIFGGYLAAAGNDVTLVDVSEAAVDAIQSAGLRIEEKDGSIKTVKVAATGDPGTVGPVDVIINFVKCYHTEQAVRSAAPMVAPQTVILSLQNGWGNAESIAAIVGEEKLLVGLTYHSGTLVAPGHVKHPGVGMTFLGELNGAETSRLAAIAEALRKAGIEVTVSTRIVDEVWKKLALNVCTLPTSALLGFFAHELNQHEGTRSLMQGLLREVIMVAKARGIALDEAERWSAITNLLDRGVGARASMLQDTDAGRRTEIDVINGAIVEAGSRAGVSTPLNDAMVWLINAKQEKYLSGAKA